MQSLAGARSLWLWLAGGAAFVVYVLTSTGHSYWLDSGEFVAASVQLDIAHPPGHPLTALWGKAFTLLPLGPLAFRVAIGQAAAAALGVAFLCRAIGIMIAQLGVSVTWSKTLGVAGAWLVAFCHGFWFQAVRPEVYALQALCVCVIVERVCTLEANLDANAHDANHDAQPDARPLLHVALVLGFALANHHLIALLLVPALLPSVWRVWLARGFKPIVLACGSGLLALSTYAYLPARALAGPPANLGDPSRLDRFAWVVSARVYARALGSENPQPLGERLVDVVVLLVDNLHGLVVIAGVIGAYLLIRHPATRRHGVFVVLMLAVTGFMRAWLGPVRANPDILGYLAPAFIALGMCAAGFCGALVWVLYERASLVSRRLVWGAPLIPLLALLHVPVAWSQSDLHAFAAPDAFDEPRLRALPARAVVIATTPQTLFRAWELSATERVRPDVTVVPIAFLGYPGAPEHFIARHPELTAFVTNYMRRDRARAEDLFALARQYTVLVELDANISPDVYRLLVPEHLLHRVLRSPKLIPSADQLTQQAEHQYTSLYRELGRDLRETETARQLLWIHYMDAIWLASLGGRELASRELQRAMWLQPRDQNVRALIGALSHPSEQGPLDVRPFLKF